MFIEDKKDKVFIPQTQNTITANDYNQIKNEIQNAIELAGMTPEKDVIQLPQALKTLTQQSGAEEVAKIEAAGQEQVQAVNTAGSTQINAVNEAGSTQTEAVNTAGQTQLNAINTAGAQAVQNAQDAAATATSKAAEAAGSATEAAGSASAAASSASAASGSASTATTQAANASASADLAQKWAVKMDGAVADGEYSAKYHAQQAADSAASIVQDAEAAAASATAAAGSASAAAQSAQDAADSAASINTDNLAKVDLSNVSQLPQSRINNIMPDEMDYAVDSYTDEAGNWYRVYKSGWLEQGGFVQINTSVFNTTVNLLKPFAHTNYTLSLTGISETDGAGGNGGQAIWAGSISTTSFVAHKGDANAPNAQNILWRACGQGAE